MISVFIPMIRKRQAMAPSTEGNGIFPILNGILKGLSALGIECLSFIAERLMIMKAMKSKKSVALATVPMLPKKRKEIEKTNATNNAITGVLVFLSILAIM